MRPHAEAGSVREACRSVPFSTVVLSTAIGIISTVTEQSLRTLRENNTLFYVYRAHSFIFTATFSKVPRFAISLD